MKIFQNQPAAEAIELLKKLIATPSFSRGEGATATILESFFEKKGIPTSRTGHNVWTKNRHFNPEKPSFLLCSHHDTVRPAAGWTRDPFAPTIENGRLFGLGSNDAGGCLVGLAAAFCHFFETENLPFNLVFAAVAEEEISGAGGLESLLPHLPPLASAIIGEPTGLQMAVAEKGLLVLDCEATGRAGHAARDEGVNAFYAALTDIEWFRSFDFPKKSDWLGAVKMSVTVIETPNRAHNVVPDRCRFVVDVRLTDAYSPEETLEIIRKNVRCSVVPRSTRLRATAIPLENPIVLAGLKLGKNPFGSPTLSDKALLPVPTLKIGPGDSARSHSADEFIWVEEVVKGVGFYRELLKKLAETAENRAEKPFTTQMG